MVNDSIMGKYILGDINMFITNSNIISGVARQSWECKSILARTIIIDKYCWYWLQWFDYQVVIILTNTN